MVYIYMWYIWRKQGLFLEIHTLLSRRPGLPWAGSYLQSTAAEARRSSPRVPITLYLYCPRLSAGCFPFLSPPLLPIVQKGYMLQASETLSTPGGAVFTWELVLAACSRDWMTYMPGLFLLPTSILNTWRGLPLKAAGDGTREIKGYKWWLEVKCGAQNSSL